MDCGAYLAKYILCIFNFILFLAGAAVLALGVWLYVDKNSLLSFIRMFDENSIPQLSEFKEPSTVTQLSYILMIAGAFIFLLSLLGYCGALSESRCLLGLFGFLLVVILILEVTAGTLAYVYRDKAEDETKTFLKSTISDYYTTEKEQADPSSLMWDLLMKQMSCCGVDNYTDFQLSARFRETGLVVPGACCKQLGSNTTTTDASLQDCTSDPTPTNSNYMRGCYKELVGVMMNYMSYVIYTVLGVVLVELLSTCLSFCLCKALEPYDDK